MDMAMTEEQLKVYQAKWYRDHCEEQLARGKKRYQENKPEISKRTEKYRKEHLEVFRKSSSQYRKKHPDLARGACRKWYHGLTREEKEARLKAKREYLKKWRNNNPFYQKKWVGNNRQRMRAHSRSRYALKKSSLSDLRLIVEWMTAMQSREFARCHWCGTKISGKEVHFDHVVALSRGGSHSIGNLCCTCQPCNQSKGARLISNWICNGQSFLPI